MTGPNPTDNTAAIQRVQAALAERARLDAFAAGLPAQFTAAEADKADALAAQGKADAAVMLAAPAGLAGLKKTADAAAAKVVEAVAQLGRLTAARDALPAMLGPVDDEILEAVAELQAVASQAQQAEREARAAELAKVAQEAIRPILNKCHAMANAGFYLAEFLMGTTLANPNGRPFIAGHTVTVDGETVFLDKTWRDDPAARAVFDAHMPAAAMLVRAKQTVRRIEDARNRADAAANRAARADRSANPLPSNRHLPRTDPAPDEPPKSAFIPNADTHNPPLSGTVRDGTLRVDISMDRTEPLSAAEMDTIYGNASGGLQRPVPDKIFTDHASRIPPWRVQAILEGAGRTAAAKARFAADMEASQIKRDARSQAPAAPGATNAAA